MISWMQSLFDMEQAHALAVASSTVDLRVTQVANQVWGVHAVFPERAVLNTHAPGLRTLSTAGHRRYEPSGS